MNKNSENLLHKYIEENMEYLKELIIKIASIISMTGNEKEKAVFVLDFLKSINAQDSYIDKAGNVIYIHDGIDTQRSNEAVVYAAHIDTVFKDTFEIRPVRSNGNIYAPSIADNSANVAAALLLIKALKELGIKGINPAIFVFDTGEEGLGNLKGIKYFTDTFHERIREVIALDGGYDGIVNKGVGSIRYRIDVTARGGHSYSAFGNKNAILYACKIVDKLYDIKVPGNPKTTYNAGLISGGTSVNTIAESAFVEIDLRSVDKSCLDKLDREFIDIVEGIRADDVGADVTLTGKRPCGETSEDSPLVKRIVELRKGMGMKTDFHSSSTDANYPMSLGIDAVTFGVCVGEKCHTLDEYLVEDSLNKGMIHLVNVFLCEGGLL